MNSSTFSLATSTLAGSVAAPSTGAGNDDSTWSWNNFGESGFESGFVDAGADDDSASAQLAPPKNDGVLVLIDCSPSMMVPVENTRPKTEDDDSDDGDDDDLNEPESGYRLALRVAKYVIRDKMISSPSSVIGVCLYGTAETRNSAGYSGIYMLIDMDFPDVSMIEKLEDELAKDPSEPFAYGHWEPPAGTNNQFPFETALCACNERYQKVTRTRLGGKRIWLFTNNDNPNPTDLALRRMAQTRAEDLLQLNIAIELFAVEPPPVLARTPFDVHKFFLKIIAVDEDSDTGVPDFSAMSQFSEMRSYCRRRMHHKRAAAIVPWTLFDGVQVGVEIFNNIQREKKTPHVWLDAETNEPVQSHRSWICATTGAELQQSRIATEYRFGDRMVPIARDEIKAIKASFGEPSLTLMGFKPRSALAKHHNLRTAQFVYPHEKNISGSTRAFAALHDRMIAKDKITICRLITQAGGEPRFVALLPQPEVRNPETRVMIQGPGMHLVTLPYADDIRDLAISGRDLPPPTAQQVNAAKAVVTSIDLEEFDTDAFADPAIQRHLTALESMALQRDDVGEVEDAVMPDEEAMADFAEEINGFAAAVYPPDYVPPTKAVPSRKRKATSSAAGPAAKRSKPAQPLDWLTLANQGKLGKATVATLRDYLNSEGIAIPARAKKADLISLVKVHLGVA